MRVSIVWRAGLLLGAALGLATMSCGSPDAPTPAPNNPPAQVDANLTALSREQIIEAAWSEARRNGYNHDNADATYDSGNAAWRHMEARMADFARNVGETGLPPMFEGHDYQVVYFHRRGAVAGGLLYVFIDINTGKVLGSIAGQ
jgi:hypothetical protein